MLTFPEGFVWGAATAAYQIEGAAHEGGRGLSIWDAFSKTPGKTLNGDTGDKAVDHYHLYKEDVQLMANMGLQHYRLSISWPRILPTGRMDHINEEGIAFYNNLIDELLAHGITPIVTLYHWDLPLALQTELDGWLGGQVVVDAFAAYARLCFERFGDRVKQWLTLNEPWCSALLGHGTGDMAPGRKHKCKTETYTAAHHLLLAHAHAVHVYRTAFQASQSGTIGLTLNCEWREPKPSDDAAALARNTEAAERSVLFELGWFADPIFFGDYPEIMKTRLGDRLPRFTPAQIDLVRGSVDFFGINSYASKYAEPGAGYDTLPGYDGCIWDDQAVDVTSDPSWSQTDIGWNIVPYGFHNLLHWIQKRYAPPGGIYIFENGCAVADVDKASAANDTARIAFYEAYLTQVHRAITETGVDVRGYFAWSFIDNYEWACGYTKRFGLHWVDYETMERMPKASARWFSHVIRANGLGSRDDGSTKQ
ncbi:beta-galactosidase [Saprolegnia parasitica CBS 223.65]|uniref:beta-glucosidase n=1 Tax=Saprolegnia parasitica (strain CBS 223.65) TaxID=695850 RepID=A0A067D2C8_SAPPC|nr:beta-galactosidase [Saprolegnia parasitica CBS 223.65]KDO33157.1 beta-galactosidase [Saprolegnia parasitica CBS 223.65]|eukprot:XP_012196265.1 beta-galactosidase [Saprolegnia parasitica CBS 223.65]